MTTFNPAQHDRDAGGKFTTMRRGELDVKLRFERPSRRHAGVGRVDRRRRRLDDFPPGRTAWCPAVDRGIERARRTGWAGFRSNSNQHREPGPVDVGRVDSARRRHRVRLRHSKGRHAHRQASGQRFRDSRPNSGLRRMGLSPQPSDNRAALDSRNRSCGIKQLAADIAVIRSYAPPATKNVSTQQR